ncbi:TNFAIP3-interacting protein 3-like isoform X1 [Stylophora pistillata]|uniref:NF-kappa-B essential modulator NEMO CC2-LZ domain-containing protein n=1 Tax=Stylophora pistillata TaxID=50429 RepID=A0A2B4S0Q4_STYPI|nr:TNFAIP3-interacting protein 3-like isoform X1 [Stylophora pistillata]PFX22629.1 hypothetical protein AWC38_SpisGene12843 [Stylophora pistillata]
MTSNAVENRCENCLELQRSLVKTLGEKRSLLLRLQKEQSRVRKLLREAEKGKRRDGEEPSNSRDDSRSVSGESGGECLEWQLNQVMEVNKKWKEDYDAIKIKYQTENEMLRKELDLTKEKLVNSETQVLALGAEVSRLAATLNDLYQGQEPSPRSPFLDLDDYEVFKQQIQVYEEDFSNERKDRERAQGEKDNLQQQLIDAQDIIATLTQELTIYKRQLNECQEETNALRRHSSDPSLLTSSPQLQVIYPVNRSVSPSQWQRRQEQLRRGILTRGGGHLDAPQSLFYGGEVEVDKCKT